MTSTIDTTVLDELGAMLGERGPAVIEDVVRTWVAESPALVAAVAPDSAADLDAIVSAAHSLKSSSRTVGAMSLGNAAEVVEHAGRSDDLASVTAERENILDLYAQAVDELQRRHTADC
jgi:HPt (histidine-containing phosphotransfer) domain-containing protein